MEKRRPILYVILACVMALLTGAPVFADDGGINWLSDYKGALRLAKQTHQPMLVEFRCEA